MGRRWYHEVSADWLKARQGCLTATDIASLVPEYKRYLKQKDPDAIPPGFAALWCQKHSNGFLDTSSPSSAAARGHIMEPYAVEEWNKWTGGYMYHWDDCIIINGSNGIGFSPDAANYPCPCRVKMGSVSDECRAINSILEVKCYEPAAHMKAFVESTDAHKERMQAAVPFAVLPQLAAATVLWYCPGAPVPMFSCTYSAAGLAEEIKMAFEIADLYRKVGESIEDAIANDPLKFHPASLHTMYSEDGIYQEWLASQVENDNVFIMR